MGRGAESIGIGESAGSHLSVLSCNPRTTWGFPFTMNKFMILLTLAWWCVEVRAEIQVAILMQGSDFINVSVVPLFDVNQFDLGDVFISPCRAGTYNSHRDSFCKPCNVCASNQFERSECSAVSNRLCVNCTVCTPRQQQVCGCNQRTTECVTGDSVCSPLPLTTANISFDLSVSQPLSSLKERFLQEGLRTGFVLFLSTYLQHPDDSIVFLLMHRTASMQYYVTFLINDMYSIYTKRQVEFITKAIVQEGLTNTFGIQSNTFSTVSQQRRRRRRLLQQDAVILLADGVEAQCVTKGSCTEFFVMSNPEKPCESTCVSLPCPPGYTGILGICELCPNSTYKGTHGNDTCTPCPTGWSSDRGTKASEGCRPPPTSAGPLPVLGTTPTPELVSVSAKPTSMSTAVGSSSLVSSQGLSHYQLTSLASVQPQTSSFQDTGTSIHAITSTHRASPQFPVTAGLPQSTISSTVNAPTPPPLPPPGGGGWFGGPPVVNSNYQVFNISFVQNLFFPEWNSGKAGTVQYIIINEKREDWAVGMAGALMVAGFLALTAIGARLFWAIQRPSASSSRGRGVAIVVEDGDGKTVIPVPVKQGKPSPPPPPPPAVRRVSPRPFAHLGSLYRRQLSTD